MSVVEQHELTKRILDGIMRIDRLGDSTKNEQDLLEGFSQIMGDSLQTACTVFMREQGSVVRKTGELEPKDPAVLSAIDDAIERFEIVQSGGNG